MSRIVKPVFLVGCGRSGTTLIYNMMAHHPDFAWFTNWTNRYPRFPQLSLLQKLPFPDIDLLTRVKPKPDQEGINIYKHCGIEAIRPNDGNPIGASEVPIHSTECFQKLISSHLFYQGKRRFLHKNTANSLRVPYLYSIFPDAKFIHIVRDGRAVALSLTKVKFWQDLNLWWSDETPRDWAERGGEPAVLAGLHWQREVSAVLSSLEKLPTEQQYEIRYEDFVASPIDSLQKLIEFCELKWHPQLDLAVKERKISNYNSRWSSSINETSLETVWESIQPTAEKLGYQRI
ncbi:MAG: sulfotransferase [Chloroflexota bacterium]